MVRLLQKLLEEGLMDGQGLLKELIYEESYGDVLVTKESVRAVQLAKGAIAAGIEILADSYGIRFRTFRKWCWREDSVIIWIRRRLWLSGCFRKNWQIAR